MLGKQGCTYFAAEVLGFGGYSMQSCTVVMLIFFFDILATGTEISVQFGTEEEEQLHTFCTHVGVLFNLSSILYFVIADNYF